MIRFDDVVDDIKAMTVPEKLRCAAIILGDDNGGQIDTVIAREIVRLALHEMESDPFASYAVATCQ